LFRQAAERRALQLNQLHTPDFAFYDHAIRFEWIDSRASQHGA
jgi:hypothetical protein